jgi:hypothetical protein
MNENIKKQSVMVNEMVKMVAKKANIPEPVAQVAVNTVVTYLKDKLPPALRSTVDTFLGTGATPAPKAGAKSVPAKKPTATGKTAAAPKKTTAASKKGAAANPLGDIGAIAGALGGLLGKK